MSALRVTSITLGVIAAVACGSDDGNTGGAGGASGVSGTTAATGGTAGTTGGTGPTFVPGSPTFTAIFQEIMLPTGCNAGAFCHGGTLGQGSLLLTDQTTAHAALVGVPAMGVLPPPGVNCADTGLMRVAAGNPDTSLLIQKLAGTQTCGTPMPPPPAPLLDAAKQQQVRIWILNGALND